MISSLALELDCGPREHEEDRDPGPRRDVAHVDGGAGGVPAPAHDVTHSLAGGGAREVPRDGAEVVGHALHRPQDA